MIWPQERPELSFADIGDGVARGKQWILRHRKGTRARRERRSYSFVARPQDDVFGLAAHSRVELFGRGSVQMGESIAQDPTG
jgi:hypothetical protein